MLKLITKDFIVVLCGDSRLGERDLDGIETERRLVDWLFARLLADTVGIIYYISNKLIYVEPDCDHVFSHK